VRRGTDANLTGDRRTPVPQGKQRGKPPVRDVPEGYGRYRYDTCDRYLGRGPDHGRTFRCSMT